jgi:hypothetical protein
MIYHGKVTLDVDINISAYDIGTGWQRVIPLIKSINGRDATPYIITEEIYSSLANDDPEYNEAIKSVKEAAEDRSVIDPRD